MQIAARQCEGCDLYKNGTRTVFGEGPRRAPLMLLGETPGDREEQAGKPFVGPAGKLLDQVLNEVGLNRETVYVTNAVKHFRFEQQGPRRLHKKPTWREIRACRPWLEAEIEIVRPEVIVCLGATAAQTLLGPSFRITSMRGQPQQSAWANCVIATYHPSAILRAPEKAVRMRMRDEFAADLRVALDNLSRAPAQMAVET